MKIVSFAYSMAIFCDMNRITEIWEAVSRKAGKLFEWAQAHPKSAYLFAAILLAFFYTLIYIFNCIIFIQHSY